MEWKERGEKRGLRFLYSLDNVRHFLQLPTSLEMMKERKNATLLAEMQTKLNLGTFSCYTCRTVIHEHVAKKKPMAS